MSSVQGNRLLLELEQIRRDINREIINAAIPELHLDAIKPIITMASRARLAYLQELIGMTRLDAETPSYDQIQQLARRRETYDELRAAVNALETAIDRDYVDVSGD